MNILVIAILLPALLWDKRVALLRIYSKVLVFSAGFS
jgi:hypothetical protein